MRRLPLTLIPLALAACADDAPRRGAPQQAYSVQLHVHGSFSEGIGSIDSQSYEARDVGLDVIWWSDHDDIVSSHRRASTFGFEDWEEPLHRNESWLPLFEAERANKKRLQEDQVQDTRKRRADFTSARAAEGKRSFRVAAGSRARGFQAHRFRFAPDFGRHRRPLAADVTIQLAIWPERQGPDARAIVLVGLSEHAPVALPDEKIPLEQYWIHYYLDEDAGEPVQLGSKLYVPLRYEPDRWNRYTLRVSDDARDGFRFIHGADNTLYEVLFGVEARNGARAAALFDALRIEHALSGPQVYQEQQTLIDEMAGRRPGMAQLQGVEISRGPHLNEFSMQAELLDYDALMRESGLLEGDPPLAPMRAYRRHVARIAAEAAHARGGLISYNHMFGTQWEGSSPHATKEDVLSSLLETGLFGADILEVGYRDRGGHLLEDHLWVWDELARNGIFPVGTGVSDAHGGHDRRWRTRENNFVSWIYADSTAKADLIDGLRAGRVFFGDLILFDGTVSLETARGFSMGQVVVTDRSEAEISAALRGLVQGDQIRVIDTGRVAQTVYAAEPEVSLRHRLALGEGEDPRPVRLEVYDRSGRAKVFSNPIVFVRAPPSLAIPSPRVAFDVAGLVSRSVQGVEISAVRGLGGDAAARVEIEGRARDGHMLLDCAQFGTPASVEFLGLHGSWGVANDELQLRDLNGAGQIRITAAPPSR